MRILPVYAHPANPEVTMTIVCIEHQAAGAADHLDPADVITAPQIDCEVCHPLTVVR